MIKPGSLLHDVGSAHYFSLLLCLLCAPGCSDHPEPAAPETETTSTALPISPGSTTEQTVIEPEAGAQDGEEVDGTESSTTDTPADTPAVPTVDYSHLQQRITFGKASLAEVRQSMTERDAGALTNTVHALYSMRWHRGVHHLIYDMWSLNKDKYPELAWDLLDKPPVRIALASTINRIQVFDTGEYMDYIRSYKNDAHEFNRAQVVVALGLNGDPADVAYLEEMADGENHYVTQSAITALALMGNEPARNAMIKLGEKYGNDPRGKLIYQLLKKTYNWTQAEQEKGT